MGETSRNVLTDPPDALTAAVESLNDVNDTHDWLRVGLSVSQVIDLSSLIPPGRRKPPPAGQEGREPTRDGFLRHPIRLPQASSIAHVTRRRHSHVLSGRTW
ncbi:hypothetical protein EVAR_102047_1 [Eumeta japonica]|uniref:Uncharacterized protein n=1 Tax=Eumeta variegata TaxID=151549 RepID=A0A4C1TZT5_EUMVA|nr:hypothetical protein EVAR_102047_1 [Eumeta japonica]